jgi:uncharacterized membrane protein
MIYPWLKWLHILAAIAAVGSNITYGFWLSRAARKPEELPFTLKTIKTIDDRLANPAYGLLLITGLAMIFVVDMPLSTPWLSTALLLYGLLLVIGIFGYSPTLKRQIQLVESEGSSSPEYQAASRRGTIIGVILAVLAVAIILLMVVKPSLWA